MLCSQSIPEYFSCLPCAHVVVCAVLSSLGVGINYLFWTDVLECPLVILSWTIVNAIVTSFEPSRVTTFLTCAHYERKLTKAQINQSNQQGRFIP